MPVTATWNIPIEVNVHERVELPDPVTLVGERLHAVLLVASATRPTKPLTAATLTVEFACAFTLMLRLEGVAEMVKS